MSTAPLEIVFLGLSITSSWGNGHATTYRSLLRQLASDGHRLHFLERDVPWYANNRDLPNPPFCRTELYSTLDELKNRFQRQVSDADVVVVGSYVPDGIAVGEWVLATTTGVAAFYDIDTPVTLARLDEGTCEYLAPDQIRQYDLYLSFTGGPTLLHLEQDLGSPCARGLYCSVDPEIYYSEPAEQRYDLGYLGTFSLDRHQGMERLLLNPARSFGDGRFIVAGPQYPETIDWPLNVERIEHLPPDQHRAFYCSQRFTLNLTRADMIRAGYAPSVRLFEAAACGVPIITDYCEGLETFLEPGTDVLVASDGQEVLHFLREMPEEERRVIGRNGRNRIVAAHTSRHRAQELIGYIQEAQTPGEVQATAGI